MTPVLTREQARAFYDRFGARQDRQGFYEDKPLADLAEHGRFEQAEAVVEFGCGTGKFAAKLLEHRLPTDCTYRGFDLSPTMVGLASARLSRWADRAEARLTEGAPVLDLPSGSCDRFVSNYVLDLLGAEDIEALIAEAERLLRPGGLLCLVSLTHGRGVISRSVSWLWERVHRRWPARVGGCRPIALRDFVGPERWRIVHRAEFAPWGIASEILIAAPGPNAGARSAGSTPRSGAAD